VVDDLSTALSRRYFTLDEEGPAAQEYEWDLLVKLMRECGIYVRWSIRIDKVLSVGRSVLEPMLVREVEKFSLRGLRDVRTSRLARLLDRLDSIESSNPGSYVRSPYLAPDRVDGDRTDVKWKWQCYTREGTYRLAEEIYSAAINIYTELVNTWFAPLVPTLGLASALPVRIDLAVTIPEDLDYHSLWVDYSFSAATQAEGSHVVVCRSDDAIEDLSRDIWDSDRYSAIRARAKVLRSNSLDWMSFPAGSGAFNAFSDTPATDLAYKWVTNDLQRLHMWHR
jgi:hypothetical protein